MIKLAALNALSPDEFIRVIGPIFENSPWIAARAAEKRPFASRAQLYAGMCDALGEATDDEKLALIRAHPDLVGRGLLTTESQAEQIGAGLRDLSSEEIARFDRYNRAYRERFNFPFVICARLNKKQAILAAFPPRLANSREKEIETALAEICKIAELRLADLVE